MRNSDPEPEEKVCYNCSSIFWGVALGLGLRCTNPENKNDKQFLPLIPSMRHTCGLFSFRKSAKPTTPLP
jgi:hypothetical protein